MSSKFDYSFIEASAERKERDNSNAHEGFISVNKFTVHHWGKQKRELKQKRRWNAAYWLTHGPCLARLLIEPRTTCPGNGAAQSGLGPTVSTENSLQAHPQPTWSRDSLSWDFLFPGDSRLWQLAIKANQGSVFSKHKQSIPFCDSVFPHHYKFWDCDLRCLRPVWLLETNISGHMKNKELCWLILRSEVPGLWPLPSHLLQPHPAEFISLDKVGTMDALKGICQGMTREQSRCQLHNATEGGFVGLKWVRSKPKGTMLVCSEHTVRKIFLCTHVCVGTRT